MLFKLIMFFLVKKLNSTNPEQLNGSSGGSLFNSTEPTSTVFSTGTTLQESSDYIAYCFHSVSGRTPPDCGAVFSAL